MITPEDEAQFRHRYKGPQCDGNLAHAKCSSSNYAEQHAGGMPEFVKGGVAALHCYCYMIDAGERRLLRHGIDCLLAMGRACINANATAS